MELEDLEDYFRQWALECFHVTKSKDQGKIPKDAIEINLNWKWVRIHHSDPEFTVSDKKPLAKMETLFQTTFTNQTDEKQQYSIRAERRTTTACEVLVEKSFMIGGEVEVGFKCPGELFELNAGFKKEMSINRSTGAISENEITWGVDSSITVPPKSETTAKLEVMMNEQSKNFVVNTSLSGIIVATVTNIRDNNSLVMSVEGNVADVVRDVMSKGHLKHCKVEKNKAVIPTRGMCTFRFAAEQKITILPHKQEN